MFEYLPEHGMQSALNSVGHMGMNIVQQLRPSLCLTRHLLLIMVYSYTSVRR